MQIFLKRADGARTLIGPAALTRSAALCACTRWETAEMLPRADHVRRQSGDDSPSGAFLFGLP